MAKLGELLVQKGWVSQTQIDTAVLSQAGTKLRLGSILVDKGWLEVDKLAEALSEQRGIPAAKTADFEGAPATVLSAIPAPFAQEFRAFPLRREGGKLVVAMASPFDRGQIEPIRSITGSEIVPFIAPELLILYFQEQRYRLKRPERVAKWTPRPGNGAAAAPAAAPPATASVPPVVMAPLPVAPLPVAPLPQPPGTPLEGKGPAPRFATVRFGSGVSGSLIPPIMDADDPLMEPPPPADAAPVPVPAAPAPRPRTISSGGDLFATPGAPQSMEGPTAPLPPEFFSLTRPSTTPVEPKPVVAVAPASPPVEDAKPEVLFEAPAAKAEAPAPPPVLQKVSEKVEPLEEKPAPAVTATNTKKITLEEMPASVLDVEKQAGRAIIEEQQKFDDEVTSPSMQLPRLSALDGPSEPPKPFDDPVSETTLPLKGQGDGFSKDEAAFLSEEAVTADDPAPSAAPKLDVAALPEAPKFASRDDQKGTKAPRARTPAAVPASPPSKFGFGAAFGMGCAAGALAAGVVAAIIGMTRTAPPAPTPPPVAVAPVVQECPKPQPVTDEKVALLKVDGLVERLDLDGEWRQVALADPFREGEQLRTGEGARATVSVGAALVEVGEYSRLGLRRATTQEHHLRLNAGTATLRYASSPVPLTLESRTGVLVRGKADVHALVDGRLFAVTGKGGELAVDASGKAIPLPADQVFAVGADGAVPAAASAPVKTELTLEPPRPVGRSMLLEGVLAGPGRVMVQDTLVPVDAAGRFSFEQRPPAKPPFVAVVVDLMGNKTRHEFPAPAKPAKKAPPPPKKGKAKR